MTTRAPTESSITSLLDTLRHAGGLQLEYTLHTQPVVTEASASPRIDVTLSGPDTPLLLERNGELLHAIENLAAAILRLEPEQAEQLSIDADGFKAARVAAITAAAETAVSTVRSTGKPYIFPAMNSRERRMLHLALVSSGLATASSGLGPRRFVVLYPAGQTPEPERFEAPPRRTSPFRNDKGYKARGNSPPARLPLRQPELRAPSPAAGDPDSVGNQAEPTSPDDGAATEARLDSIRRAFRKR